MSSSFLSNARSRIDRSKSVRWRSIALLVLVGLAVGVTFGSPAVLAHQNFETGAAESGTLSPGYATPSAFYNMTFGNPKMRMHLQDNTPYSFAYNTGNTSTTAFIDWDVTLSPKPVNCNWMPYDEIQIQKRDLDDAGNPLTPWKTFNFTSHRSACVHGQEEKHWGPDSVSAVHQGGTNFEMRLLDSKTGAVYLTATGPGAFWTPTAPNNLLVRNITTTSITVDWLNNARAQNSIEVHRTTNPTGTWSKIATVAAGARNTVSAYTDNTVASGQDYWYRVRAVNGPAASGWSNEAATKAGVIDRERTYGDSVGVNPTGELGDPVNTLTGSFTTSVTDVSVPGIGLPFVFERTYNSMDTSKGKLGAGWTHPFESSLNFVNSTKVQVKGSDGQRLTFTKQADGSYKGEPGARATLHARTGAFDVKYYDGSTEIYDVYGKLWERKDANGNKLQMNWSSTMTGVTDTAGRSITFSYNAANLLSRVTLPDGRFVAYTYTPGGLLETVTDVRGGITTYNYDAANRLVKIVDQNTNAMVTNTYNAASRVIKQVDARGHEWLYSWDAPTQTASVTDPRGNIYKDVYSGNVLRRRIDPLGNVTALDYDSDLNVTAASDPRGKTTTMTYDSRGNMLTRTAPSPLLYEESWSYNSMNRPTSYTNGRGYTTTYQYDLKGNLDLVTEPGNVVTDFVRNATTGQLTSIVDPRGKTTIFRYDTKGNLEEVQRPSGAKTTFGYDAGGRMTSMVEPLGNAAGATPNDYKTAFSYNAANQVTSVTGPLGHTTTTAYDAGGRTTSVRDAKNRTTTYGYNPAGLLTSVTAPDNTVTAYTYDPGGNLLSRTDAGNHTTAHVYDAANRLTKTTLPTGHHWTHNYDAASNVVTTTTAIGNATAQTGDGTIAYEYDALGRVKAVDYSDNTPDVTFTYDANGNLRSMTDGAGTETYDFDGRDRLTSVTRGANGFTYSYDAASNLTARSYPGGIDSQLTYDDDGLLSSVTTGSATTTYTYDAAGRLKTTALPTSNGHVETRTYDRAGNLVEIENARGSTVLSEVTYTLDDVGNPTAITTLDGTSTYAYDALDRLKEVCYGSDCSTSGPEFIRYTYDDVGNRLSETRPGGTTTYDYDTADRLLSTTIAGASTTFGHDENGNMTAAGSRSFTYDLAGRMTSATTGAGTISYEYDGLAKRIKATSGTHPSDVTKYLWDPNAALPTLALERDGSDSLLRSYEHGSDLISMASGSKRSYYHYDMLGSVTDMTSSSGDHEWAYSYEPFGTIRESMKVDAAATQNQMLFTGELQDPTGLYHLRARQYDASLGRFTRTDPVSARLTRPYISAYAYADNRATVLVDPSGLTACSNVSGDIIHDISDSVAAFADWLTFGLTERARVKFGVNDCVNKESIAYTAFTDATCGEGLLGDSMRALSLVEEPAKPIIVNSGTLALRYVGLRHLEEMTRASEGMRNLGRAPFRASLFATGVGTYVGLACKRYH